MPGLAKEPVDGQCVTHVEALRDNSLSCWEFYIWDLAITCPWNKISSHWRIGPWFLWQLRAWKHYRLLCFQWWDIWIRYRGMLGRGSILWGRVRVFCSGKMLTTIVLLDLGMSRFFGGTWHSQCVYRSCLSARVLIWILQWFLVRFGCIKKILTSDLALRGIKCWKFQF